MTKVEPEKAQATKEARFEVEFAKIAARWDEDGNGSFSMDECKAMVKEITSQKGRIEYDLKNKVDAQMAKFDKDGNGQFDYHEVEHEPVYMPPRERHEDYIRNPVPGEMFVPEIY